MIEFKAVELVSTYLDPRRNFSQSSIHCQVRLDPLTGRTCHFSHFGALKAQKLDLSGYEQPEVKGFCPFCLDNREKATPKFLPNLIPEGRQTRGEACLIPNLFPYDIHSAVVIMTNDHVVGLRQLSEGQLADSLLLGIDFLRKIDALDPDLPYHLMTWNYMPPSGGGLVHPHQQYFATQFPGNQFMDELSGSERFFTAYRKNYWHTLIDTEISDEKRYIGKIGATHWLAPFVSMGILGEIMCIFPDVFSLRDFEERHIKDLVSGLGRVFRFYEAEGIFSFNASLSFGPRDQRYFSCFLRIVPRTFLNMRDFAPDLNFFQAVLSEPICIVPPEDLCEDIKPYFA